MPENILGTTASVSVDQAAMDLLSVRQQESQAQAEHAAETQAQAEHAAETQAQAEHAAETQAQAEHAAETQAQAAQGTPQEPEPAPAPLAATVDLPPVPAPPPAPVEAAPAPAPLALPAGVTGAAVIEGAAGVAFTPANEPIDYRYAAVPASALITSHGLDMAVNPEYDQSLQGRDRARAASAGQIASIAAGLNPKRLGANPLVSEGAPVVGPDMMVESGNGRTLGILQAYQQALPSAEGYRSYLQQNAGQFGLNPSALGEIENPVLVRVRQTPMDAGQRAAFSQQANVSSVGVMGDAERAQRDASALLASDLLPLFRPSESGGMNPAANREFLSGFASLLPESERGAFVQGDGSISAGGVRQAQSALLAAAYPDSHLLSRMMESTDDNARNISGGMLAAAGPMASVRQGAAQGDLHPLDLSGNVSEAANLLSRLRDEGTSLNKHLATGSLFGDGPPPTTEAVARFLDENKRSSKRIGQVLSAYAEGVQSLGSPNQTALFDQEVPTPEAAFAAARQRVEEQDGILPSAGGPAAEPEDLAASRAEAARSRAERERLLTDATRSRLNNPQFQTAQPRGAGSPRTTGFNAEAANQRAADRPTTAFAARPSESVLTAPPDANSRFDTVAYDEQIYAQRLLQSSDKPFEQTPPPAMPDRAAFEQRFVQEQVAAKNFGFFDKKPAEIDKIVTEAYQAQATQAQAAKAQAAPPAKSPLGETEKAFGGKSYEGEGTPYQAMRERVDAKKADILADARNIYTERGDFNLIDTPVFKAEVQEGYRAAGIAPPAEKPTPFEQAKGKADDLRRDLSDTYASQSRFTEIGGKGFQRDLHGIMQGAGLAPPSERDEHDRAPYAAAMKRKADVESSVRDDWTTRGDFSRIGSEAFHEDVHSNLVEAGLVEPPKRGLALVKERLAHDKTGVAFGIGYSAMSIGSGVAAMERLNDGQYVTPEQKASAQADAFAPAAAGIAGTLLGTAAGGVAGGLAGQFIGGALGQAGSAVFGASEAREQATRESAERLTAALGEAASATGTFKSQIEATGAPVAQLGQALATVGSVGTYGTGTVAGTGALTNAFQERAGEDFATIAKYTSSPLLHGLGNRVSTGAADSGDISALGYDAAENGDFTSLKTLQDAARRAKVKSDPAFQDAARHVEDVSESQLGLGSVAVGFAKWARQHNLPIHNDITAALDTEDARQKDLSGGPDPVAKAQNDLANQFVSLKSNQIVAESGIKEAAGGITLAELRGAGSAGIASAGKPLLASVAAARTATQSEIGLLQGDLADPLNAGRGDELKAKIADAQTRLTGYDVTEAQQARHVFTTQVEEDSASFGRTIAGEQQDLTRGLYGGKSLAALRGDEDRILSSEGARAAQLRRTALNPLNSPADRDKLLTEATGIETGTIEERYKFGLSQFQERERGVEIEGAKAGAAVQFASVLGTPMEAYGARLGQVQNERAQVAALDTRLHENIPFAERQALTQQKIKIEGNIAVGPEQARLAAYGAQANIQGDVQGTNRAGFSRDLSVSGNAAFARNHVFEDDAALTRLYAGAEAGSPAGSTQRARFGRMRAGAAEAAQEDQDSAYIWRQTGKERVHDMQDEGAFHRALIAPYRDGPESNPLTRGNAVLGDLRDDLRGQQAALAKTPQSSPAYEANARQIEDTKNRIASLEHERLTGMFSALPETIVGRAGSGIMAGIVPTSAMTARYTSNPSFGSWGAPSPSPVSTSATTTPGGHAGGFLTAPSANHSVQGAGAGDIVAAINRQTDAIVRAVRGGGQNPSSYAGGNSGTKFNPARPPM